MFKFMLALFLSSVSINLCALQGTPLYYGIEVPSSIRVKSDTQALQLNGYAMNPLWGSEGYVAMLYVYERSENPNLLLITDQPALMSFTFLQEDITRDKLIHWFTDAIMVNNPDLGQSKYDLLRFKELMGVFRGDLHAGDNLSLYYSPHNQTLIAMINKQEVKRWTQSKSFFNRLLKIWLGAHPPSRDFKQHILGL